jgi:hypothetical protein
VPLHETFDSLSLHIHTQFMSKSKIAFVFLCFGISTVVYAASATKTFHSLDGVDKGCKLAKFAAGKWTQVNEKDLSGQEVSSITPSKANGDFSNFKFQNAWYASKNECLKDSDSTSNDTPSDSVMSNAPKYAIDLKIQKTLLLGSGNSASPSGTLNGVTSSSTAYSSGFGFDGRFLYHWKDNKFLFLDISNIPMSLTTSYTSGATGTSTESDSLLMINVGVQVPLIKPIFGLKPYVAGYLGYTKLTGTITGPVSTGGPIGNLAIAYSGGGYDLGAEAGLVKEFSPHWNGLASLGFTYVHVNSTVSQSNLIYTPGDSGPIHGYSHFTLGIGARYNF